MAKRISEFYGVTVSMYYRDHNPPHIHATYGSYEARLVIDTGTVLSSNLPARALSMVREWMALHRDELRGNWDSARQHLPLAGVAPLT